MSTTHQDRKGGITAGLTTAKGAESIIDQQQLRFHFTEFYSFRVSTVTSAPAHRQSLKQSPRPTCTKRTRRPVSLKGSHADVGGERLALNIRGGGEPPIMRFPQYQVPSLPSPSPTKRHSSESNLRSLHSVGVQVSRQKGTWQGPPRRRDSLRCSAIRGGGSRLRVPSPGAGD